MRGSGVDGDGVCDEFDVPFDQDRLLEWPVDPVGMGAVRVVSNPACFNTSCIKFGSCARVDPDRLSPFGHA